MKKTIISLLLLLYSVGGFAQTISEADVRKYEVAQNTNVPFRLFPMANMWNFIKLDTRTGQLWGIQYSAENYNKSFTYTIDDTEITQAIDENIGRFTLYPTSNVYIYILLDQKTGMTWQVQNFIGGTSSDRFRIIIL